MVLKKLFEEDRECNQGKHFKNKDSCSCAYSFLVVSTLLDLVLEHEQ